MNKWIKKTNGNNLDITWKITVKKEENKSVEKGCRDTAAAVME